MHPTLLLSPNEVECAARLLLEEQLVAFPTETVYGLGGRLFSPEAVAKIFSAKGRPSDNPLIAHLFHFDEVDRVAAEVPEEAYRLAEAFIPGPLTLVLKRAPGVPPAASGGLDTIAVRVPSHPVALALLRAVAEPVVAPSANLSGRPSATCPEHVLEDFQGRIAAVIDGGSAGIGLESTVVGLQDPARPLLLRPGSITQEAIEALLGRPLRLPDALTEKASPGMRYRHYAPKAQLLLFTSQQALLRHAAASPAKHRLVLTPERIPELSSLQVPLEGPSLYAFLRHSDAMGCDEVLVLCTDAILKDAAIMNRLYKAAEGGCIS